MAEEFGGDEVELQDKTLDIEDIDKDYIAGHIQDIISQHTRDHEDYFRQRSDWIEAYRDMQYQSRQGFFDNSANYHSPLIMTMAKATHARLWQIFGQQMNFFSVEANNASFIEKEELIRRFMNWVLSKWMNRGLGFRDVADRFLMDVARDGSGVLKLSWDRWVEEFVDVDDEAEITEETRFNPETLISDISQEVKFRQVDVERKIVREAPRAGRVLLEDFFMPPGHESPQNAPWVAHRVYFTDEDMKRRAQDGKFDEDVVEECISQRSSRYSSQSSQKDFREIAARLEGIETQSSLESRVMPGGANHSVIEWYGRVHVEKNVTNEVEDDIKKLPREVVVWMHEATGKILGWTYLHRINPAGIRPFFKADFIPSDWRSFGIGVAELLYSTSNHIDAMHNLRLDNGILASLQFGFYRGSSSLKPENIRLQPGELYPVDDINDVKMMNFPFLANFAGQEEESLKGTAERLLAISDLQLGQTRGVSGALRNATGASLVSRESNIQLNIHFDRIARALNLFLRSLFNISRDRMPEALVFRVTGEDGRAVFSNVKKSDLQGDFDFDISVDILAASESEKQQRAVLMMQTLQNPMAMQLGIVQPDNVYNLYKNFAKVHGVKRIDDILTKPQGFTGPKLSTLERIHMIIVGKTENPNIEDTVRPDEDHQIALQQIEDFKNSDALGFLDTDRQLAALRALEQRHQEMMAAMGSAQLPNRAGLQTSPETLGPIEGIQSGQPLEGQIGQGASPVEAPLGGVRGPVV